MNQGRVPDINALNMPEYNMTEYKVDKTFHREAVRGELQRTPVSDVFFSKTNIDALQEGIRYLVWINSCKQYVIGTQNEQELKIIMRSMYLQHSKNLPVDILEQVRELNSKVLEFAVGQIMSEIKIYLKYKNDLAKLPVPMDNGAATTSKGTRVLEMKYGI